MERLPLQCILPPYILDHLAESANAQVRKLAIEAIAQSAQTRGVRSTLSTIPAMSAIPSPAHKKDRLVYDAKQGGILFSPGKLVRNEGGKTVKDVAVNEAYNHAGDTYDFFLNVLGRNSLDDKGMTLVSSVHVNKKFNNAFWNGEQMAYGDGDGNIFTRFTKALDVVGHELSHGLVMHTSNLEYQNEQGALNESFADVFGSLIKQWKKKQTAAKADWLIGAEIMGPGVTAKSLRTLKPVPAYQNDPLLGNDPQPKLLKDKYTGTDDHGGVHYNSGIPNHAFFLVATNLGGSAWTKAGKIWYKALLALTRTSQFADAVEATMSAARTEFGTQEETVVKKAWQTVGF